MSQENTKSIYVDVDASPAETTIREMDESLDQLALKGEDVVETINTNSTKAWNRAVGIARSSYAVLEGVIRIGGGSIDALLQSIILGGISAIEFISSIIASEALTGVMTVQAVMAGIELAGAIGNIINVSRGQKEISQQTTDAMSFMNDVSSLIGRLNW